MPATLTPEQQQALETFETDAQAAKDAKDANATAQAGLASAQLGADTASANNVQAHQKALESARSFIDLMIPPEQAGGAKPQGAAAQKK